MYRIYIMVLVIVLQFMNVQNIYYGTCYCTAVLNVQNIYYGTCYYTAVYKCTEYILWYLLLYCTL